jgi:hypothetical protein
MSPFLSLDIPLQIGVSIDPRHSEFLLDISVQCSLHAGEAMICPKKGAVPIPVQGCILTDLNTLILSDSPHGGIWEDDSSARNSEP